MKSFALTGRTSATDKMSDALTKSQATCQGRKDFALRTGTHWSHKPVSGLQLTAWRLVKCVHGTLVVK